MGIKQFAEKFENNKVTLFLRRALSSYYFPLVTAAVAILGYYTGVELLTIWYLAICGTAILICCKDVSPIICVFLFVNVIISLQHCPLEPIDSQYLSQPAIAGQIIAAICLICVAIVYRFVLSLVKRQFRITPMFWGLLGFSLALTFGGIFYSHYSIMSLIFGFGLGAVFLCVYVFMCANLQLNDVAFKKIAFYFLIWFAVVALELIVAYFITDGLIVNGKVERTKLMFGWGTYNNTGVFLTLTIPAWFYFARKCDKWSVAFIIGGLFNLAMCFLSMARQGMLMGVIIFIACCVWLLVRDKGKKRLINACVMGGLLLVILIVGAAMHDKVGQFFSSLLAGLKTGNGRTRLWQQAMDNFLNHPLLGIGFYDPCALEVYPGGSLPQVGYFAGDNLSTSDPYMCHNTIFQILSASGLVGLVAYVVHRMHTVFSYIDNPTDERTFIALTVAGLLLLSLLGNHIFSVLPTLIYSALIAMLTVSEKKDIKSRFKVII
ncbi:MAG: O-antigen ligase family protein [Clostridia bacterium]|nr:O-antigen ligase family protein [Clostridia bacterium]